MKIQLPVRWADRRKLDDEDQQLKRLLNKEDEEGSKEDIVYTPGSIVLDLQDIRCYNDLDEDHCILRTYHDDSYCVTIGFENLKRIMVELTGENITMIRRQEVPTPAKKTRKPPRKDESSDDDIIIP